MSAPRRPKVGPYRAHDEAMFPVWAMLAVSEARAALRRQAKERMVPHLLNLGSARRNGTEAGYIAALEETVQVLLELVGLEP